MITKFKSGKARVILMSKELTRVLSAAKIESKSEFVVYRANGKKLGDIQTPFKNVLKRAGIKDFWFHDLRRTAGSRLLMQNTNLDTIKDFLGHSSLSVTERYLHSESDGLTNAVTGLGEWLSNGVKMEAKTIRESRVREKSL